MSRKAQVPSGLDASRTPVLVGVGQVSQRVEDPLEGAEPLELMRSGLRRAGEDCGVPRLIEEADSVRVIRGAWPYVNPARELAHRLGANSAETVGTQYGGNYVQVCVNDAACDIQAGRRDVILVGGAENGRSSALARRNGLSLPYSDTPGVPDRVLGEDKEMAHPAEVAVGLRRATEIYAIIETGIRSSRGESLEDHARRIAELWAGFNEVACNNPHAWIRKPYTAEEIGRRSAANPMIDLPYPRLMNANSRVDMGAGLVLCSLATARRVGVPDEKIVYLHACTQADDSMTISRRQELHSSVALREAGRRALALAGVSVGEIDHFDVYSCFPSAVQVAAAELEIPADRALTVTGGLTFGGGPLNCYVLSAIARMAEVLREDRGSLGLVTANGGFLSKHAFGVYSTTPPSRGFQFVDLQPEIEPLAKREVAGDWEGPVTVEGYTVQFRHDEPQAGLLLCVTPQGARTWTRVEEPALVQSMIRDDFCGVAGKRRSDGLLAIA